jgi:predicted cupin superfamily sugar epimerase
MSRPATDLSAKDVIDLLGLAPHPEGGHFRETFRDVSVDGARAASTAIYFLLREGEVSRWHRVDAVEVWHWYAGAPLVLSIADDAGHRAVHSLGEWTLVGCTVAPGFEFAGFEMAPPDFNPLSH